MHCMEPGGASDRAASKAVSQLRKGVLEYCVLALMRDGARYGVELLRELEETGALATSQGTVYPLLSRLRRDELVVTTWRMGLRAPSALLRVDRGRTRRARGVHRNLAGRPRGRRPSSGAEGAYAGIWRGRRTMKTTSTRSASVRQYLAAVEREAAGPPRRPPARARLRSRRAHRDSARRAARQRCGDPARTGRPARHRRHRTPGVRRRGLCRGDGRDGCREGRPGAASPAWVAAAPAGLRVPAGAGRTAAGCGAQGRRGRRAVPVPALDSGPEVGRCDGDCRGALAARRGRQLRCHAACSLGGCEVAAGRVGGGPDARWVGLALESAHGPRSRCVGRNPASAASARSAGAPRPTG